MPDYTPQPIPPLDLDRAQDLAERVHRILDGGTPRPDSRYDRRELVLHAVTAYEAQQGEVQFRNAQAQQADFITRTKLEKEWYFDDLKTQAEYGGTRDQFITSYLVPVHTDPATDRDYVDLPQAFLDVRRYQNLPGEGVQDVVPLSRYDRRRVQFVPTRGSQDSLIRDLFKSGLEGAYTYCRRGARVEFDWDQGLPRPAKRFAQLELLLVVRARQVDELPDPPLLQAAQDFDIIARMLKLALKQAAPDKIADNNPAVQ